MQEHHLHACWSRLVTGWIRWAFTPWPHFTIQSHTTSRAEQLEQPERTATPRFGHTTRGPPVQGALSFWDFDGESGRRCLLICPHMDAVWLRCWGLLLQLCIVETRSQPDLSWVSSHSPFFLFCCKYLAVCLWILICCMTKLCFTQSQFFLSYFSIHSNWHNPSFQSRIKWMRWCEDYIVFIFLVRFGMAQIQLATVEIGHNEHFSLYWLA